MILVRREHQIHSLECITFMMAAFDFLQETKPIVGGVAWLRCQRLILCMIFLHVLRSIRNTVSNIRN